MNISAIALQGLEQSQTHFEKAASQVAQAVDPCDSVDLSQAAVNLISAKNDFAANIKVAKVADEMERAILDMLA